MVDTSDFESMERALARAADRHVSPPLDPRRVRRRSLRLQVGPWLWLLAVSAFAIAAALDSSWIVAGVALLLVAGAVDGIRDRRKELAGLGGEVDLVEFERRYFARQAKENRMGVAVWAAIALLLAAVASSTGDAHRWIAPAVIGALAAARLVFVLPFVERANRDAGGEPPWHWVVFVVVIATVALMPFVLLFHSVRGALRMVTRRRGGGA